MSVNRVGSWMALILFVTICLAKTIDAAFTCKSQRDPRWFYSSVLEDRLNEDDIPDNCDEIAGGYSRTSSFFVGNDVLFQMKDLITGMEICIGRSSDCSFDCFPVQQAEMTTANSGHPSCARLTSLYSGQGASFAGTASLLTGQCSCEGGNTDGHWGADHVRCLFACINEADCIRAASFLGQYPGSGTAVAGMCDIKTWYNIIHFYGGFMMCNQGCDKYNYGSTFIRHSDKNREMSWSGDRQTPENDALDIFQIRLKVPECEVSFEFNLGEGYAEDKVHLYYGTSFTQTCATGYSGNGGGVYTCPGGTFSGTILECTADSCDTTAINTGEKYSTNCESLKTNGQCEQACTEGYVSTQGVSVVYTCPEGSVEGTPLICEDVDECLVANCLEMDLCVNGACPCPPYYTGDNVNSPCELADVCPEGYVEGSTERCVCHPAYSGCGWDADAQDYITPISSALRPVVLLMGFFTIAALS